ncbi:MAG: phosphoglucomutase [Desulfobulbaceae bacterium]|nr:phosphoglucomutase [Desulfobulbaceae bacterium]
MERKAVENIFKKYIVPDNHPASNYFQAIKELIGYLNNADDKAAEESLQKSIDQLYALVRDEIIRNTLPPTTPVKFGTSGWRGSLGKDINLHTVACVTAAILTLYRQMDNNAEMKDALGVRDYEEMRQRGCVIGFDNRFCGDLLALGAMNVLAANGVRIFYAGEAATGTLSAAVLEKRAAFSINLTPSHNPLEYGGFKYNAADAGPAAAVLTAAITEQAGIILAQGASEFLPRNIDLQKPLAEISGVEPENALDSWRNLVRKNTKLHGLDYDSIIDRFNANPDMAVAIDCVHGAFRVNIADFFKNRIPEKLIILRGDKDVTFGGIAPEPSSENMAPVMAALGKRRERLKVGAIIDPDADRIRFTDGSREISMNQFGAMAYHFLHEVKGKKGMVAKTVASSNLANAVAAGLGEEIFEPRVGFKEFKPVIGKALVCFEESDGISIIGHTPEKDAYIGLLLALDMTLTLEKNLGEYLREIEERFGAYYPARDGVAVSRHGEDLINTLAQLEKYRQGVAVPVGNHEKPIAEVITIDGRKMIFDDKSWIMIRPSGTEPKVRFYVEARNPEETVLLVEAAKSMLAEIGLLT